MPVTSSLTFLVSKLVLIYQLHRAAPRWSQGGHTERAAGRGTWHRHCCTRMQLSLSKGRLLCGSSLSTARGQDGQGSCPASVRSGCCNPTPGPAAQKQQIHFSRFWTLKGKAWVPARPGTVRPLQAAGS